MESTRLVTTVPTEVWDMIMHNVSSAADLASLAVVCTRLHSIVSPNHLNYRVISTPIDNKHLWDDLSVKHVKAACVQDIVLFSPASRRITVGQEEAHVSGCLLHSTMKARHQVEYTPTEPFHVPCSLEHSLESLQSAASAMRCLRRLALCVTSCELPALGDFFASIHVSLEKLEIHVVECSNHLVDVDELEPCAQALRRLQGGYREFAWTSVLDQACHEKILEGVIDVLVTRCPHLEDLDIATHHEDLEQEWVPCPTLWAGKWPRLRRLSLDGLSCNDDGLHGFCQRIEDLQELRLIGSGSFLSHIWSHGLPRLRSVETDGSFYFVKALFAESNDGCYRPIETLKMTLNGDPREVVDDLEDLCYDAGAAGVLRNVSFVFARGRNRRWVADDHFLALLKIMGHYVPTISTLTVNPDKKHTYMHQWHSVLSRFSNLETLRGCDEQGFILSFRGGPSDDDPEVRDEDFADYFLDELESYCPTLKQVDDWVWTSRRWVRGPK